LTVSDTSTGTYRRVTAISFSGNYEYPVLFVTSAKQVHNGSIDKENFRDATTCMQEMKDKKGKTYWEVKETDDKQFYFKPISNASPDDCISVAKFMTLLEEWCLGIRGEDPSLHPIPIQQALTKEFDIHKQKKRCNVCRKVFYGLKDPGFFAFLTPTGRHFCTSYGIAICNSCGKQEGKGYFFGWGGKKWVCKYGCKLPLLSELSVEQKAAITGAEERLKTRLQKAAEAAAKAAAAGVG